MAHRELETDLIDYFIAAFTWGIRDHEKFEQFWTSIYTTNEAQDKLLARFSNDGRVLGLAVHETIFQESGCPASYDAYATVDNFVDRYVTHALDNTGCLPVAREVAIMARMSVVLDKKADGD